MKKIIYSIILLIIVLNFNLSYADLDGCGIATNHMWGTNIGSYGSHSGGRVLYSIIKWGLIILITIFATTLFIKQKNTEVSSSNSALEILKSRYVKGEIDKKEFEEKKKHIL